MEAHLNYIITILLPSGERMTDKQLAVSNWHAVDKSYTKNYMKQPTRVFYSAKLPLIKTK